MTGRAPLAGPSWQPSRLGRLRQLARGSLRAVVGARGEAAAHGWYHDLLRALGRFGPPESPAATRVLAAFAARSQTIIDVGANVGRYSWFLARRAPQGSRLYALEPHPGAARLLRRTVRSLRHGTVLQVGVADRDHRGRLVVPRDATGGQISGLAWVDVDDPLVAEDGPAIPLRRVDSLVDDGVLTIERPVLLKVDVEGGEARVLEGARELIRRDRPVIYFECQRSSLERAGSSVSEVFGLLEGEGYGIHRIESSGVLPVDDVADDVVNYLAVPDSRRAGATEGEPPPPLETLVDRWARWTPS